MNIRTLQGTKNKGERKKETMVFSIAAIKDCSDLGKSPTHKFKSEDGSANFGFFKCRKEALQAKLNTIFESK